MSNGLERLKARRAILLALYDTLKTGTVASASGLKDNCGRETEDFLLDLHALQAMGYVRYRLSAPITALAFPVELTPSGIILVEDASKMDSKYPLVKQQVMSTIEPIKIKSGDAGMTRMQIRRTLLEALYEAFQQDPYSMVDGAGLSSVIGLDAHMIAPDIVFLEEEGYVSTERFIGGEYLARITSKGVRLVESPNAFNSQFPPISIISGNTIIGSNVASNHSSVKFGTDVASLKEIIEKLVASGDVSKDDADATSTILAEIDVVAQDPDMEREDKTNKVRALWGKVSAMAWKLTTNPMAVQALNAFMKHYHLE